MSVAVITGASSGLGAQYAREIEMAYPDIDEIYLIARRKDRLSALCGELSKKVEILDMDLQDYGSYERYRRFLEERAPDIKILINNAGFGKLCDFEKGELSSQTGMCDVNVRALTAMALITLPYMKKGGFIINVCSIAAFVPTPRMTVYCSTKAYVMSFSKSLREELKVRGINVLAVCPAPMDTEFLKTADIVDSKTFDALPRVKIEDVAKGSLYAAAHGRAVYTNRAIYKFYRFVSKMLPHNLLMKFTTT